MSININIYLFISYGCWDTEQGECELRMEFGLRILAQFKGLVKGLKGARDEMWKWGQFCNLGWKYFGNVKTSKQSWWCAQLNPDWSFLTTFCSLYKIFLKMPDFKDEWGSSSCWEKTQRFLFDHCLRFPAESIEDCLGLNWTEQKLCPELLCIWILKVLLYSNPTRIKLYSSHTDRFRIVGIKPNCN